MSQVLIPASARIAAVATFGLSVAKLYPGEPTDLTTVRGVTSGAPLVY